jgi:hypothetical protein
VDRLE